MICPRCRQCEFSRLFYSLTGPSVSETDPFSVLHRDADDVQAAQSYLQKPLSHMREPGVFEKHKQVLQDSAIQGDRFSTSTDALTNMMEMQRNRRSLRWVTFARLLFLFSSPTMLACLLSLCSEEERLQF